ALTASVPWIEPAFRYGGAAFLLAYSARAFWSASRAGSGLNPTEQMITSWRPVLATTLALTWLNPHVYLDTLVLLGSISTQYPGAELVFGAGAVTASFSFFFALGYGARLLRPLFAQPSAWRVLDGLVGLVMLLIGIKLII
ncbi:MAG: LysE family transporter, partial [Pseudomonadota bacterium]